MSEEWRESILLDEVSLGDVVEYFESEIEEIEISKLLPQLGPLPKLAQKRIKSSSLNYPIVLAKRTNQMFFILDGNHRLQKALSENRETIRVRILDLQKDNIPRYIRKGLEASALRWLGRDPSTPTSEATK